MAVTTSVVKNGALMMPASKATDARMIPGPPRALDVIAKFRTSRPRNPPRKDAIPTPDSRITEDPTRNTTSIKSENSFVKSSR